MTQKRRIRLFSFLLAAVLLLSASSIMAQDAKTAAGDWYGRISSEQPPVDLPIIFHIKANEDGSFTATTDSPDQNATGIPVETVKYDEGVLIIEMPIIGGTYKGKLNDKGVFEGSWSQGGYDFTLNLSKEKPKK